MMKSGLISVHKSVVQTGRQKSETTEKGRGRRREDRGETRKTGE